jgi:hypothetical protein
LVDEDGYFLDLALLRGKHCRLGTIYFSVCLLMSLLRCSSKVHQRNARAVDACVRAYGCVVSSRFRCERRRGIARVNCGPRKMRVLIKPPRGPGSSGLPAHSLPLPCRPMPCHSTNGLPMAGRPAGCAGLAGWLAGWQEESPSTQHGRLVNRSVHSHSVPDTTVEVSSPRVFPVLYFSCVIIPSASEGNSSPNLSGPSP